MSTGPTREFWEARFTANTTPWDRGAANPALAVALAAGGRLAALRESVADRPPVVVVPGCGSGHELALLAQAGFAVIGLDYAQAAVDRAKASLAALSPEQQARVRVERADVLAWEPPDTQPDAVWEQTCLCALHPDLWCRYAERFAHWLPAGGLLHALFVQMLREGASEGRIEGPPYHCDINAMRALFPAERWEWPKPPYALNPHPSGMNEMVVPLVRG